MPTLMERFKVPHFDAKGEADAFFVESWRPDYVCSSPRSTGTISFTSAWSHSEARTAGLVFALPMGDAKLAGIAAVDIGKCAFGIFQAGDEFIGKTVGIAGEHLTGADMAKALGDVLGEQRVVLSRAVRHLSRVRLPRAPTTWATCSSSTTTSTTSSRALET